jgi:hypothetical protein
MNNTYNPQRRISLQKILDLRLTGYYDHSNLTVKKALNRIKNDARLKVVSSNIFYEIIKYIYNEKLHHSTFVNYLNELQRGEDHIIQPVNKKVDLLEAVVICSVYATISLYELHSPTYFNHWKNYKIEKVAKGLEELYHPDNHIVKNWMIKE